MRHPLFAALCAVLVLAWSAVESRAAVITYDFTATGRTAATVGAVATGSISFDTLTPPDVLLSDYALYPGTAFEVMVAGGTQDGASFSTTFDLEVFIPAFGDPTVFISDVPAGPIVFGLADETGLLLTTLEPPENLHLITPVPGTSSLRLYDSDFGLPFGTGSQIGKDGTFEEYQIADVTLRAAVVPLPAGGALLLVALVALTAVGVARRRVSHC